LIFWLRNKTKLTTLKHTQKKKLKIILFKTLWNLY